MEMEIGIMWLQVKQHLGPPEAGQGEQEFVPGGFRGSMALATP